MESIVGVIKTFFRDNHSQNHSEIENTIMDSKLCIINNTSQIQFPS